MWILFLRPPMLKMQHHIKVAFGAAFFEFRIAALIGMSHAFEPRPQTCL